MPMAKGKRSLSVERDPARVDKPEKERKMRRQLGCGAGDLIRSSGEVVRELRLHKQFDVLARTRLPRTGNISRVPEGKDSPFEMRWLLCLLFLGLSGLVRSLSSSGDRLLVVIEEAADESKYSQLWSDLKGAPCPLRAPMKLNDC